MIRLTSFLSMVSVCLPSDALLQVLPSYLGFSYLGRGVLIYNLDKKTLEKMTTDLNEKHAAEQSVSVPADEANA